MSDISRLRPKQIYAAMEKAPLAWIPLGAIEWHGWHAPVGLDALTSSGLCSLASEKLGGLVLPPFHYGSYASIASHPWTILLDQEDNDIIIRLLIKTLRRLEEFGVKQTIILTGHFSCVQKQILEELNQTWNSEWRAMELQILNLQDAPNPITPPDHGGLFETALLASLEPELINLNELPDHATEDSTAYGSHRRDPSHPLYGIIGTDPRQLTPHHCTAIREQMLEWIISSVTKTHH